MIAVVPALAMFPIIVILIVVSMKTLVVESIAEDTAQFVSMLLAQPSISPFMLTVGAKMALAEPAIIPVLLRVETLQSAPLIRGKLAVVYVLAAIAVVISIVVVVVVVGAGGQRRQSHYRSHECYG